jgi:hypothetical protein
MGVTFGKANAKRSKPAMHQHEHDENSAANQADAARPTDPMAALARGVPGDQPPLEKAGAHIVEGERTAAGYHSIYETAHFGIKEMGLKRTFQTLSKVNQKDGFDCPSCAWPDPDGKRKMAEFCATSDFRNAPPDRRLDGGTRTYHAPDDPAQRRGSL